MHQDLANLYRYYRTLRDTDPVHWHPKLKLWVVTRHAEAAQTLSHPALSSRRTHPDLSHFGEEACQNATFVHTSVARWLLRTDPPAHTSLRRAGAAALRSCSLSRARQSIEAKADSLLRGIAPRGSMDVIADFAAPLSLYSVAVLVGVPIAAHGRLQAWADVVGEAVESAPDPVLLSAAHRCLVAAGLFVRELLAERRRSPTDDLLGALARSNHGGASLDEDGITDLVMLLLLAGHETATHLTGNGLLALLRHADQICRLRADPSLSPRAIQELLRYASPLHGVLRTSTDDIMLGEQRVRRGDGVCIVLAAANRDPDVFPDPERLDTGRSATAHLAFGRGPHRCLGAALAEVTCEIGISSLLRSFPDLRLARHDAEWQGNFLFRSQRRLLVSF